MDEFNWITLTYFWLCFKKLIIESLFVSQHILCSLHWMALRSNFSPENPSRAIRLLMLFVIFFLGKFVLSLANFNNSHLVIKPNRSVWFTSLSGVKLSMGGNASVPHFMYVKICSGLDKENYFIRQSKITVLIQQQVFCP